MDGVLSSDKAREEINSKLDITESAFDSGYKVLMLYNLVLW